MAFDAATYAPTAPIVVPTSTLIDTAEMDAAWAAANPDRALAFLFVAPQDCAAVDVLISQ